MERYGWMTFVSRPPTGWKRWPATVWDNTAFASTFNGGFVSFGATAMPMTSRSSIIIDDPIMTERIDRDDLARIDFSGVATDETLANVTPGEVLREEFMRPMGLSARRLARELGVPANRITAILNGDRTVTAETAVLLSERFRTSAEFWMNLQTAFDLEEVRRNRAVSPSAPVTLVAR